MLSQFTPEGNHQTLADLAITFDKDIYPVGRLDADSEGLLLLTNDKSLTNKLLSPQFKHYRTYWVQVDGDIDKIAVDKLSEGVTISVDGKKYDTLPAKAKKIFEPTLPERNPPVRFRKNIPTSWVEISLIEGKNRQVRKMTAAVNFPTLRLVRSAIESLKLGTMQPGDIKQIGFKELQECLKLNKK